MIADNKLRQDHFIWVFDKAQQTMVPGEAVFCGCDMTNDTNGSSMGKHAIGIVKQNDEICFFDANVGAYKVADSFKFNQFYEHWGQLCRDKLKLRITGCTGYRVRDIPGVTPPVIRQ